MRADDVLAKTPAQDFIGTFGNARAADLPVPPLKRQFLHQTQTAVDLDGPVDHAAGHFRGHDFDHIGQIAYVFAAIDAQAHS